MFPVDPPKREGEAPAANILQSSVSISQESSGRKELVLPVNVLATAAHEITFRFRRTPNPSKSFPAISDLKVAYSSFFGQVIGNARTPI
jgi:hypothetical protein